MTLAALAEIMTDLIVWAERQTDEIYRLVKRYCQRPDNYAIASKYYAEDFLRLDIEKRYRRNRRLT